MPIYNVGENSDVKFVEEIKQLFNKKYNLNLQTTTQFHPFDLKDKDNKTVVEVKRRYINHDAFKTLIMNHNKYVKGRSYIEREYTVWFVAIYNDGIYCHKYNNEIYKIVNITRRDQNKTYKCVEIPIQNLSLFEPN